MTVDVADARPETPRLARRIFWAVAVIIVAGFAVGTWIPQAIIATMRPIPTDLELARSTTPAEVRLLGETGEGIWQTEITTAKAKKSKHVELTAVETLRINGDEALKLTYTTTLNRSTSLPVVDAHTELTATRPDAAPARRQDKAIAGIRYFFPYNTERRSYAFVEAFANEAFPIDYAGKTKVDKLDAYRFHQDIPPTGLSEPLAQALGVTDATYQAQRTVLIEPATGRILDLMESQEIHAAGQPVYEYSSHFDEATRAQAYQKAVADARILRALQVASWLGNVAVAAAIIYGAWVILRYRQRLNRYYQELG